MCRKVFFMSTFRLGHVCFSSFVYFWVDSLIHVCSITFDSCVLLEWITFICICYVCFGGGNGASNSWYSRLIFTLYATTIIYCNRYVTFFRIILTYSLHRVLKANSSQASSVSIFPGSYITRCSKYSGAVTGWRTWPLLRDRFSSYECKRAALRPCTAVVVLY